MVLCLTVVSIAAATKVLIIGTYYIPSQSMAPTLSTGDHIIVNKTSYGIRFPESPLQISWFNLFALIDKFSKWFAETRWEYRRWPESREISRDDIIVFEGPWEDKAVLVKRCKGLPGETIEFSDKRLYINGTAEPEPNAINYTKAEHMPYGPVLLPKNGLTINLRTFPIEAVTNYLDAINKFEGASASIKNDSIYINGKLDSLFTFNNDYYFLMGDNRNGSDDSRVWGFIPLRNVIGKATLILYSKNPSNNQVQWSRVLKALE